MNIININLFLQKLSHQWKIKKNKNNANNIKPNKGNFRIKSYKSYNDPKRHIILNPRLVKEINNLMNLYDFNYISKINRTENIIQNNPKLIKRSISSS